MSAVQVRPEPPYQVEEYPSLAEGIGLENRQGVKAARVRILLPPPFVFNGLININPFLFVIRVLCDIISKDKEDIMNNFSHYLKQKKKYLKQLLAILISKYEFASILGTDVKGKTYFANKSVCGIRPTSVTESGFVARIFDAGVYYEYSFNEINKKNINDIVEAINEIVKSSIATGKVNARLYKEEPLKRNYKRETVGESYSPDKILNILKEDVKYGLGLSDAIINISVNYDEKEYSKMYLSKERELTQYYTWYNVSCNAIAKREENVKYAYEGFGSNDIQECFMKLRENIDLCVPLSIELLNSVIPTPGTYTIVTSPSITGLIAHEAFGHGLEMDMFVKDRAKSVEYMNKPVASKILSMHDGAKSTLSAASYFFDDEGASASDTKIIDKGILVGGICDSISASILNYKPTGNGRRESYKNKSYTRMTNTYFEKGKTTFDDMIKSVEYGYYIDITNNGMEDPKNWGIQCTALYGREIKDGKFTGKIVSPVVMSGYVIDLLQSITMISKDNFDVIGSGFCGKGYKEWVCVSDGGASLKTKVRIG